MEFHYRLKSKQEDIEILTETKLPADTQQNTDASKANTENHLSATIMEQKSKKRNKWRKDRNSIILLLFLYLLQGVPLGMAGSIPLIIQTIGVSWSQQALFSFAFWPFSLKLLWAPVVDALYMKRFGRRKSWLIPTQYLIGLVMVILSYYINDILTTTKTTTESQPRE